MIDLGVLALHDLTSDGDTIGLPDGRTLRLRFEPDHDATIAGDGDWYGALAPVLSSKWSIHTLPRPAGFDGRAQKIRPARGDTWWWQPPADVTDKETLDLMRRNICDILDYGYSVVVLELIDGADAYGRPIVRDYTCVAGVEPFPSAAYVSDLVGDLFAEIDLNA